MKTLSITALLILSLLQLTFAQSDSLIQTKTFKHAIGVTAGFTIGNGLSYRFSPNKFEAQVSFAPYKTPEESKYSLGLAFFYKLVETPTAILFVYQGNQYIYSEEMLYNWDETTQKETYDKSVDSYLNNGLGIGIRFVILKRVGLDIMGGYAGYQNFTRISFTGEFGLHFMF